jgi:hypothetical protein
MEKIIDFHHHYTPPELMGPSQDGSNVRADENGNPYYRFNAELADLPTHVRMMDRSGIDVAVLSCGEGFDQPSLATCRLINDSVHQAERNHPSRFVGLAHVPALNPQEAALELKRCAVELGFPGVVISSEVQGQSLDDECLRPFWKAAAGWALRLHPSPAAGDLKRARWGGRLARMLGWSSLYGGDGAAYQQWPLTSTSLNIQISHFAGGIGRYLPRIRRLQQEKSGTASIPRHNRQPQKPFEHYLHHRLFYDCAGWSGPDRAAERGAEWVRAGLAELPTAQVVFATDYPQAVRDDDEVVAYVDAIRALGAEGQTVLAGANVGRLIPRLNESVKAKAVPEAR